MITVLLYKLALASLQKHHSDPRGSDRVTETQMHVDDLKGIMVRNIGKPLSRPHVIKLTVLKTVFTCRVDVCYEVSQSYRSEGKGGGEVFL